MQDLETPPMEPGVYWLCVGYEKMGGGWIATATNLPILSGWGDTMENALACLRATASLMIPTYGPNIPWVWVEHYDERVRVET